MNKDIFKAYDVRGLYPGEVNAAVAARVGKAYAAASQATVVAVGRDVRHSGSELQKALVKGLVQSGVDVVDIGIITTDQLYFAVGQYGYDGGISVTASHNPGEYNGFKFAMAGGAPPSIDDMKNFSELALANNFKAATKRGTLKSREILDDYVRHVLGYIDTASIKPFKVVANANFGAVGRSVEKISRVLGLEIEKINWQEDGTFPKGPPNPLLPESRKETIAAIKNFKPELGVAWDADADRCFFYTGGGEFVPSCFIIAILAEAFLQKYPGAKIIHDLTTSWVIDDTVKSRGGVPLSNRTGHTFIKRRMREEGAVFAGESSGHYYFKDSFYADNGIVPFLIILEMMSMSGKSLEQLVRPLMDNYKVSGEINFTVSNPPAAIAQIESRFGAEGIIDKTDGLVVESGKWRFSVRPSNSEPLFRLNAEAKNQQTLDKLVAEISSLIRP